MKESIILLVIASGDFKKIQKIIEARFLEAYFDDLGGYHKVHIA